MRGERPEIEAAEGVHVVAEGRRMISFAGCDTLGLARHPEVMLAARDALGRCGVSASASRTTTGTWTEHVALERALAEYLGAEDVVSFASGWLACQSAIRALAAGARAAVMDGGAHPGVRDAVALSGLPASTFARFDAADASRALEPLVGGRPILATCTVDLVTGEIAPLGALAEAVAEVAGTLVVDDAHGVGVLGARGRGAAEHCGAAGDHVVVTGTLSKAFGTHGGFVAGTRALCDAVRARAPAFAGATPLPPALAAAARCAVEVAATGDARRRLGDVCRRARDGFASLGLPVSDEPVPWLSVRGRPADELRAIETRCADAGLLVPYVTYHGAPTEGYVRVALSAAHEDGHIDRLLSALASAI